MVIIAHRGNVEGPNPDLENKPSYLMTAVSLSFDVELDVWYEKSRIWLGHDYPTYLIDPNFLKNDHFWCHAKNIAALDLLMKHNIHCFFHNTDDVTLTSRGFMWTYPGKELFSKSVAVVFGKEVPSQECYGICTDYPIML